MTARGICPNIQRLGICGLGCGRIGILIKGTGCVESRSRRALLWPTSHFKPRFKMTTHDERKALFYIHIFTEYSIAFRIIFLPSYSPCLCYSLTFHVEAKIVLRIGDRVDKDCIASQGTRMCFGQACFPIVNLN
jgi:hypothetical protein